MRLFTQHKVESYILKSNININLFEIKFKKINFCKKSFLKFKKFYLKIIIFFNKYIQFIYFKIFTIIKKILDSKYRLHF